MRDKQLLAICPHVYSSLSTPCEEILSVLTYFLGVKALGDDSFLREVACYGICEAWFLGAGKC